MSWTDERLQYELTHKNSNNSYRSKQWFKKLTDEEKQHICDIFEITPENLKHAGCETISDGIGVDLLRVKYPNPIEWKTILSTVTTELFQNLVNKLQLNIDNDNENIQILKELYLIFYPSTKFLKYKINRTRVYQTVKSILNNNTHIIDELEQESVKETFASIIKSHLSLVFSDLKMIKK